MSDILHNSTAPVRNASRYRGLLEDTLPDIFQSLQARHLLRTARLHRTSLRAVTGALSILSRDGKPFQEMCCSTTLCAPAIYLRTKNSGLLLLQGDPAA